MHIEFILEEPSCEAVLKELVPKILPAARFGIHTYRGKQALIRHLPGRLTSYRGWLPSDWRIVVLLDADVAEDCLGLKAQLEAIASDAGLSTRSRPGPEGGFSVLIRLAVEELEAWFFGDVPALNAAYPRVPSTLGSKARYRDPDAIRGGTWEALERVLRRAGYHTGGFPKVAVARSIAAHMDPSRNRSKSFQVFRDGLLALAATAP